MQLNEAAYHCHKLNWRLLLKIQPNAIYFDMKLNENKKRQQKPREKCFFFCCFLMETVEIPKDNFWSSHLVLCTKEKNKKKKSVTMGSFIFMCSNKEKRMNKINHQNS